MDELCWLAISGVHGKHELRFFIRPLKTLAPALRYLPFRRDPMQQFH